MPVALGHVSGLTLGILPPLDGDGLVKPPPQPPPGPFGLPRRADAELLHRQDTPLKVGIEEGLPVGAVVQGDLFPVEPAS